MNQHLLYGLLATMLSSSLYSEPAATANSEKSCCQTLQGPPGPPGSPGLFGSTAFASSYTNSVVPLAVNDLVPFPITSEILNITHTNNTDFIIQQTGYYYIMYGANFFPESESDDSSVLAIFVNNIQKPGTQLSLPFSGTGVTSTSLGCILFLNAGDTVVVKNILAQTSLSVDHGGEFDPNPYPTTAYINFIRLASF